MYICCGSGPRNGKKTKKKKSEFYSISIPNPQHIPPSPKLSHLESLSFFKSVSEYLFCEEVHSHAVCAGAGEGDEVEGCKATEVSVALLRLHVA